MRKFWLMGAALAASFGCSFVQAQTLPDEYAKLIQQHRRIGTLDDGAFGDRIGLSTGGLSFVQTDVDLPGNNALAVRVGRRFEPGSHPAKGHFADWDLDIPHLHGVFGKQPLVGVRWVVGSTSSVQRCSQFDAPPELATQGPNIGHFSPDEYWHGSFLYLPGSGDQELLLSGDDVPTAGGPYPVSTREGAVARCLATLAPTSESGSTGEGFQIVTPDGTTYTFDHMVSRAMEGLTKSDPAPLFLAAAAAAAAREGTGGTAPTRAAGVMRAPVDYYLERREVFLYPSLVTDRFGNTVAYTWDGNHPWRLLAITASDGRQLELTYSATDPDSALVQSVSVHSASESPRTWYYAYDSTGTDLVTVTQPDSRSWQFAMDALYRDAKPHPTGGSCDSMGVALSGGVGTITAPSGASASFTVTATLFGRSWASRECVGDPGSEISMEPYLFLAMAITDKTITGPGLPGAGLTWQYAYGAPNQCWTNAYGIPGAVQCTTSSPVTRTTTVTAPDGTVSRYVFGNRYAGVGGTIGQGDEGLLRSEAHGVSGGTALRTRSIEYGDGNAAPYGAHQGQSVRRRGDWTTNAQRRPQRSIVTTQQGASFDWSVATTCSGMPYCFDTRARPTNVVRIGVNTPAASQTETIAYDDDTTHWILGQVASRTIDGIVAAQTTFDANHLPWKVYAFGKLTNTFTYDTTSAIPTGQRGTLKTVADGNNNITTYTSWKRGIPQSVAFPATPEAPSGATRTAVVNDQGWITAVTDENGFATGYAYDAMGRIAQVTYPVGDSTAWNSTTSVFEPVASAEHGLAAGHWRETVSTGNARKVTLFDALWRPVLVREYDTADLAGTDRYLATTYDQAGRVADTAYPLDTTGAALTLTGSATWQLGGARPNGVRTTYDALGRPTLAQQDSELGVLATTTAYLNDFKRQTTDARNHVTTMSFMAWDSPTFDWPVLIAHPAGAWTHIARDTFGKPTRIRRSDSSSPTGGTLAVNRDYTYNAYQELCRAVEPETGATLYGYDAAGNLKWSSAGLGSTQACEASGTSGPVAARRVDRTYDARNRVGTLAFPDGNGNQSWAYTPDGLPASATTYNDAGTTSVVNTYAYNKRRLLTAETSSQPGWYTWSVGYTHDANGHVASQAYPDGVVVGYAPDALGQPTQVASATQTFASGVSYFPNGAIRQFTYGNGIVHTLTRNARQLPLRSRDADGSTSIHDDTYAYDPVGNVASIADGVAGNRGNRNMTYDALDRLTDTTSPMYGTTGAHYTYDVLDNVTHTTAPGRDQADCYDATNRLTLVAQSTCGGTPILTTTFDVQGNLATWNALFYRFDYGNRLREITGQETYRYDAQGRRVLAWTPTQGSILSMYTQSGQLAFQNNQRNGARTLDYVYLGGSLVATRSQDVGTGAVTVTWQHTDALGSPVATTDAGKTVLQRSEYEPYGKLLNRPLEDGPGYTGHVTDAATQLVYMQQRYYDPRVARFWSADAVTVDSVTGWNFCRYCYAANNPYKFKDPDGRIIDTLVDAAFTIYDTGRFLGAAAAYGAGKISGNEALASAGKEGLKETSGAVAVDAAAAAIPGLSVPMIRGAERIAAHADEAIAAGRAVRYEATTAKGAGQIERTTNISQDAMKANLADSGFKQLPSNGKVQVFSDGKTSYVFRSDKPTVEFKPNATGKGPAEIKIRTGVE